MRFFFTPGTFKWKTGILVCLVLWFLMGATTVQAQELTGDSRIFTDADIDAFAEGMRPNPADVQWTDQERQAVTDSLRKMGYAFQRLKDIIILKKEILWGDIIHSKTDLFYDSTYIFIHNIPEVNDRGMLITITNRFGYLLEENKHDPYVEVHWKINPLIPGQIPYKLQVTLVSSASIPGTLIDSIEVKMNQIFYQKTYASVYEPEQDIEAAIDTCLSMLGKRMGTSLAPRYLVRVNNSDMVSGSTFQAFPGEGGDTLVAIDIIDRSTGEITTNEIVWENAYVDNKGISMFSTALIGSREIRALLPDDTLTLTVNIISNEPRDVLMTICISLIYEAIDIVLLNVENNLRDRQADIANVKVELQHEHEVINNNRQNVQIGNSSSLNSTVVFLDGNETTSVIPAPSLAEQPGIGNYKCKAERYERMIYAIGFLRANKQYLVSLTQGDNFTTFSNELNQDIGRMSANLLYNLLYGGSEEAKNYLVQFITQKMMANASAH